jgi:hypothetical protein
MQSFWIGRAIFGLAMFAWLVPSVSFAAGSNPG